MLKVIEAFAGVGSQRMALRNLGIEHEVVGIFEIDKFALKSYEAIHGECPNLGDISKIKVEDIPDHDLFTYSFPCQDLSIAGKQKGMIRGVTRSGLLYECERIIKHCKPKYLLLENVKNLVGKKNKPQFDEWLKFLEDLGYTNYWKVLNAKDYGVPQNRERVFVVSILGDHKPYTFPQPIKLNRVIKDVLEDTVDEKYYMNKPFKLVNKGNIKAEFTNIKFEQDKRIYGVDSYCQCLIAGRTLNSILIEGYLEGINFKQTSKILSPEGISTTLDTMQGGHREPKILQVAKTECRFDQESRVYGVNGISPTLAARDSQGPKKILISQATKKGYIEMEVPGVCDLSYPNSKTRRGRVQENGKISPTLTASENGISYINKEYRVRKLTPLECWRLMAFTDEDFYKAKNIGISNSQLYKQAGNSIVVKVLEGIFKELFLSEKENNERNFEIVKLGNTEVEQFKWVI